ncbi:zinc finger protein 271 [Musca domestica]|uniref:Zinc finger protein 271 n=1 Tax=Musca domestica TaxID=7370 RepID=A0ABM3UKN2_MUSDO|nr:zinc finger protein 271 [Musca domestica]
MCSMSVLCPLCHRTSFSSIDALRCSLIKAANGPLACPICHELFLGLDKLTIHLFSHTSIMNANDSPSNNGNDKESETKTTTAAARIADNNNNNNNNNNEILKIKQEVTPSSATSVSAEGTVSKTPQQNITTEANSNNNNQQQLPPPPPLRANTRKSKVGKSETKKISKKLQVAILNETELTEAANTLVGPDGRVMVNDTSTSLATCDICEFTFRNAELRDMHVRLVHQNFIYNTPSSANCSANPQQTEPDFKCHLCSKVFKMKGSLRVHLKVVHLMGLPYVNNIPKLDICERIRHKENKQIKASTSSGQSQDMPTTSNNSLNQSEKNIYNLPQTILPASAVFSSTLPTMAASIDSSGSLGNLSLINITPTAEFVPAAAISNSTALPASNVLLVFNHSNQCPSMPANTTSNTSNLDKDKSSQMNSSIAPTSSNNTTTTITLNTSSSDNPKIWECDVCSKAFTTKYFLKKHKRLHTGEMPYTCETCGRSFTFQQSYHKHLLYHSDEKKHVCGTCGRAFKELSTLHNHERIHSGEKPFKCDVCGKSFRQRVSFLVHTRIHTGVMPYKCEFCQKSFRYKVSQRTHKCQPLGNGESNPENANDAAATLDHISVNFIKAFLENSTNTNNLQIQQQQQHEHSLQQNSPASNEISAINDKLLPPATTPLPPTQSPGSTLNEHQALLTKAIDDIVVESCNKLGIGKNANDQHQYSSPVQSVAHDDGSMSPSQKLQNMRLYSPQLAVNTNSPSDMNGIGVEGDLTRFFLENSSVEQNIL